MRTNIEILENLSINHKKLKEDKPLLFHNILKAMDKAKSQAINYKRCGKNNIELLKKEKCNMCNEEKDCQGHVVCEDCGVVSF